MKIAILGASSQIAKDLIFSFAENTKYNCVLFVRDIEKLGVDIRALVQSKRYQIMPYSGFSERDSFDVIINFVGAGDPALAKKLGVKIFEITERYDQLAIDYIKSNPSCKYIFLSSGAVYGGDFEVPVTYGSLAKVNINSLNDTDWYAIAKLYAEARHRAMSEFRIIDVRVFNYFSCTQNSDSRFLISDIVRSIKDKKVLKTSSGNIVRDFITPTDFFGLINSVVGSQGVENKAVDCYTRAPIDKFSLLKVLSDSFFLEYELQESFSSFNATGLKLNYFSLNKAASGFGYEPRFTSIEGLVYEIKKVQGIK